MARIRTIKPEFFDSPGTAAASHTARLLFIAMWCWADDWGVGTANPKALIGFAFPNDDDITAKDFPTLRKEVADAFGVTFYKVEGRPYYCIPSWDKHQRTERKAKRQNPPPPSDVSPEIPGDSGTTDASEGSSVRVVGSSGVGTGEQGNRGTGEEDSCASADAERDFDDWYQRYPRKRGRGQALKAYRAARKKTDHATLVEAIDAQAAHLTKDGIEYVPYPATWLNGERWADTPDTNVAQLRPDRPKRNGLAFVPTCPTCAAPPEDVHDPDCPDQSWTPPKEGAQS